MKKKMKRIGILLLCVGLLFGNVSGAFAAEEVIEIQENIVEDEPNDEEAEASAVDIRASAENAEVVFDKEAYAAGDQVIVTITPDEGYLIEKDFVTVISGEEELSFHAEKDGDVLIITFEAPRSDVEIMVFSKVKHHISFTFKDMYGKDGSSLFATDIDKNELIEGTEVIVSVNYTGMIGWTADVTANGEALNFEMTENSIRFVMPDEDVQILLEEMEQYDKGDLSEEDTQLGEDVGKKHDVTTSKEYEPDILLGKSAKWENIEEGLAELTLTEKDTSDWSDNPSDYIIILDRTRTMALDDACFWSGSNLSIGSTHSVCLNEDHFYLYNNTPAKLIDYSNGYFVSDREYFSVRGSRAKLWERHYNSSGTKIVPGLNNGCVDRLTLAQNSIKDIMDVLEAQNKNELAGGLKNRVMYWSFSGPTYADKTLHPDGLWEEVPAFTSDISNAKKKVNYESYAGTYYNNSFDKVLDAISEKQMDADYKDIPTKVIFISDGIQSDSDKAYTTQVTNQIKALPNTKLYTILIGNGAESDAGKLLKSYANKNCFATVTSNWDTFVNTITAIQQDQFEIGAVEKVLTDKINTKYWEVVGNPILETENGTATLNCSKSVLTWNIPTGEGKTYTCKLKLKLKDEYRYLLSDTTYPTNLDDGTPTDEDIKKEPTKAGAVLSYKILGGKYNTETRKVGIRTPKLKYGTVEFEGIKHWTVEGSFADSLRILLKRTMPETTTAVEVNNTTTNVTKEWKYSFTVRQMPDGSTYPLIKYNNAGKEITYAVLEEVPDYYMKINEKEVKTGHKITTEFYNEPFRVKAQLTKVDEETKNLLSGAEFTVYVWSRKANDYVPYRGTNTSVLAADANVVLKEGGKGVYTTPVWLYYSSDNEGKFRIIETKAPKGYLGDWQDQSVTNSVSDKKVYDLQISKDYSQNGEIITLSNTKGKKFVNQRVKGEITFAKQDVEAQQSVAQGDGTLAGAVYKLYAAEDIVHQDGTTGVLYKKGEEIKVTLSANSNGMNVYRHDPDGSADIKTGLLSKVRIKDLELGKYYLKEVRASEGYLVNPETYTFDLAYEGEKKEVVKTDGNVYESVKKQSLTFYKYTGDNNSNQLDPMKGAKFSIYLVSELENGRYTHKTDDEIVQAVIDELRNPTTLLYDTYNKYQPATVYAAADDEDVTSGRLVKKVSYTGDKTYVAEEKNAYFVTELESDEKGVVKTPALPYGRYVVIETTTPDGKTATRPFVINVTADEEDKTTEGDGKGTPLQDKQLTILIDRPIMSLIRLMKRDENSKNIVLKDGAAYVIHDVEGAWFDYMTNEMTTSQKNAYKEKYGDLVVQYSQGTNFGTKEDPFVTKIVKTADDESANVYIETPMQLPSGTYELEEISAPEGYILQGYEGVIAKNQNAAGNGTFYETEKSGAWEPTPQGRKRFVVSSSEAVYDETIMSFVTIVKQDNEPAVGKISIYAEGEKLISAEKENDSEDYEFTYGLKPIEGAKFEIRAAEDIYSQEGGKNAVRIFGKGALVATLISDENGQTWTGQEDWEGTDFAKGLPLGKYTVTQTASGEGLYLSEENKQPRIIEIAYAGQEVPVIYRDTTYTNLRQKVKIEVVKKDAQTGELLTGAVFGLYAKEDILNYEAKIVVKAGTLVATAETTADGTEIKNAVFAPELPLGQYYVRELKAPAGYATNPEIFDVDASYAGWDVKVVERSCVVENQKTKNLFTKSDIVSGVKLAGAQFEIREILTDENGKLLKNEDGSYQLAEAPAAAWISKAEEGYLVEGLTVGKTYLLREVQAPEGYVGYEASSDETKKANKEANTIKEEIMFLVKDTSEIVEHDVKDQSVVGNLNITKEGEFLTNVEISVLDQIKNLFTTIFDYVLGRVENVTFDIYVKEDVYTPDGSGAIATWTNPEGEILKLKADTLLATVVTDYNGMAQVENLPLGKYFVKEVSTGNQSNFLLSKEVKEFELAYVDQDTPVVEATNVTETDITGIYFINERQKVNITLDKYRSGSDKEKIPVQGAVFGLYTAKDIYGYVVEEDKTVKENITALIPADTLIATVESDQSGKVTFAENLPCGTYYVKEISPADGYLKCESVQYIDASYTGEDGVETLEFYLEAENVITEVKFRKTDLQSGKDIAGAALQVVEKDSQKVIAEWSSAGRIETVEGLKLSDQEEHSYIFREVKPADGYVTAEDIEFKLVQDKDESGYLDTYKVLVKNQNTWKPAKECLIEMQDDITRVEIDKIDKELGIRITGAKLELHDSKGKVLATWTSSEEESFYMEKLPVGMYTIMETEVLEGYQKAKKLKIEVKDTAQKQTFIFENIPKEDFDRVDVEKSTIEMTKVNDTYKYEIDTIRNKMAASMENFTVTDVLPEEVRLSELHTGTYSGEGVFDVEYRTNKNEAWRTWMANVSTLKSEKLSVADLGLKEGEYVTAFRMSFGEVEAYFKNVTEPVYFVKVLEKGDGELLNRINISGTKLQFEFMDEDTTITKIPNIEEKPDYPKEEDPVTPATGDPSNLIIWGGTLGLSCIGIAVCVLYKRKSASKA